MKSNIRLLSKFLRWLDSRRPTYPMITARQFGMYLDNQAHRDRLYWSENRGRG